jgi:apolipoprotein D and lipocalin family protein
VRKLLVLGVLVVAACAWHPHKDDDDGVDVPDSIEDVPMLAVPYLDLPRYLGRWYMIANIPYFAEAGNKATYVDYSMRADGMIEDVLTALDNFGDKPFHKHGLIDVTNKFNNAEGRITFLQPLWQDYAVLYVDEKYQYTVIGHPSRNYCWVFSRTPEMSDEVYARLLAVLAANHFKTERVLKVPQKPEQVGLPGYQ